MNSEAAKAEAFIARLLANPALADQNPFQKEEQVLHFLNANSQQLYPTLASANFFPGYDWQRIWGILIQALTGTTDITAIPLVKQIVGDKLDLSFISFFRQQSMPASKVKQDLEALLLQSLNNFETRRELIGSLNAILFRGDEKYIEQIYQRKEYIHFELTKVQRLRMGKEEVKNVIRACLLMRPLVASMTSGVSTADRKSGLLPASAADRIVETFVSKFASMPEQIHSSTVNSTVSFLDNRFMEATARITSVIASMYHSYRGNMKIDRGADTQDKSWINTARRNFKYFGYDVKLLDELYKIAAENGW